jgi:ATP-dependent DNA helicase RecQ
LLSLESPPPIVKDKAKWTLTTRKLSEAFWERAERLTALRREEQAQMQEYVGLKNGHMEFLIRALDGDPSGYRPPSLQPLPNTADPALVQDAMAFLRRTSLPLEPRKMWPSGGLPHLQVKGKIAPEHQLQPGKVLCVWGDAGWGTAVRLGKYHDDRFGDDLVAACADLVRQWNPQPAPAWVTCIPSRRHPRLVSDFAQQVATALGLPFQSALEKTDDRAEQKRMANSIQQARNIDGSIAVHASPLPSGPVLLIDDMVDSKWTLTVAGYLLATHGSGPVFPLALASTSHAE